MPDQRAGENDPVHKGRYIESDEFVSVWECDADCPLPHFEVFEADDGEMGIRVL